MKSSKDRRANIRFDEQEYMQICNDARIHGNTVPEKMLFAL